MKTTTRPTTATTMPPAAGASPLAGAGAANAGAAGAGSGRRFPIPSGVGRGMRPSPNGQMTPRPVGRGRVRMPELVLGVGLAAAGALASVLWASHAPSQRVLVAARSLHRGEVLDASMIRWATVSGDPISGLADPTALRGATVDREVVAGAPIQQGMLRDSDALVAGEVEIGLALQPGDYPPSIAAGDSVSTVIIPAADPTGASTYPRVLDTAARVRSVSSSDSAAGTTTVITLAVPAADAGSVLAAARVRLAILPAQGER